MIVYVWFVVVPVRRMLGKVCPVDSWMSYCFIPAHASLAPLRDNTISSVTSDPLTGAVSVGAIGAVVSRITCLATLYGLIFPMLNSAFIFFAPSPGVRFIAWSVYGKGINSGTPTIVGFIFPLMVTFVAIFENSAAWSCVVLL